MNKIIVEVNKKEITIGNEHILQNYWIKYVTSILQTFVEENETDIVKILGDDLFEEVYDLIDDFVTESNNCVIQEDRISEEITNWGEQLKCIILDEGESITIRDHTVKVKKDCLKEWTDDYFKVYIIPYLQVGEKSKVVVDCSDEKLKQLFVEQLTKNGILSEAQSVVESTVAEITVVETTTDALQYIGDDIFVIKHDFEKAIQVPIHVRYKDGKIIKKQMNVFFPYYKKEDQLEIKSYINGTECGVIVENMSSHIMYKGRF